MKKLFISMVSVFLLFFNIHSNNLSSQFELISISVGGHRLQVELADTPAKRQVGLMNRSSLSENRGMLFVFPSSGYKTFWMKNTYIPLSIGFFTPEKVLVDLYNMKPNQTEELYPSSTEILYALEVNEGWYSKRGIAIGAKLELPGELKGL